MSYTAAIPGRRRYRSAMEYARLETAKLRDIDDTYYYGAQCRQCGHGARLNVAKLCARLGDDSGAGQCQAGNENSQTDPLEFVDEHGGQYSFNEGSDRTRGDLSRGLTQSQFQ